MIEIISPAEHEYKSRFELENEIKRLQEEKITLTNRCRTITLGQLCDYCSITDCIHYKKKG